MREIKFRAWKKTKYPEMFNDVAYVDWNNKRIGLNYPLSAETTRLDEDKLENFILMQYTGVKDKNGVEIYEGDIDRSESGEISVIVYLIKAGSYCVMPLEIYLNEDFQNAYFFPELLYNFGYDCTFDNQISEKYLNIVGNIHENPELLSSGIE